MKFIKWSLSHDISRIYFYFAQIKKRAHSAMCESSICRKIDSDWWWRLTHSLSMTIVLCVCFILLLFFKPWPQKNTKNFLLHTFAAHFSSLFFFISFYSSLAILIVAVVVVIVGRNVSIEFATACIPQKKSTFTLSHTRKYKKKLFNFCFFLANVKWWKIAIAFACH